MIPIGMMAGYRTDCVRLIAQKILCKDFIESQNLYAFYVKGVKYVTEFKSDDGRSKYVDVYMCLYSYTENINDVIGVEIEGEKIPLI